MGEHQGENASSPLEVRLSLRHVPIEPMSERPAADPRTVPAEAIVEEGPADWWTIGRRVRLGMAAQRADLIATLGLDAASDAALRFSDLTGPYASLNGEAYDGRLVHALRPDDPVFAEVPAEAADLWRSDEFMYLGSFPTGGTALAVGGVAQDGPPSVRWTGHDGGDLDWWSVDAVGPLAAASGATESAERWPDRFRWPGGPAPRWWQIEDHVVDLGGLPPDRAHLATTMLLDLLCGHADDWFLLPVPARAGYVLSVDGLEIIDSFGDRWPRSDGPDWPEASGWSMFQVTGCPRASCRSGRRRSVPYRVSRSTRSSSGSTRTRTSCGRSRSDSTGDSPAGRSLGPNRPPSTTTPNLDRPQRGTATHR
ncbi:MAG TPA: hypothetical protein VK891_08930 [Euzebyales bacterium]|nr:hypothetical protein [Euzebyales bacterium]